MNTHKYHTMTPFSQIPFSPTPPPSSCEVEVVVLWHWGPPCTWKDAPHETNMSQSNHLKSPWIYLPWVLRLHTWQSLGFPISIASHIKSSAFRELEIADPRVTKACQWWNISHCLSWWVNLVAAYLNETMPGFSDDSDSKEFFDFREFWEFF